MNQILLGAAIPFAVLGMLYAARRGRASLRFLLAAPIWLTAGMLWAIAPDLPRVLGMTGLYHRLARNPKTDLFFWHYSIDRMEGDAFPYHIPLAIMGLLILAAAWRELACREGRGE